MAIGTRSPSESNLFLDPVTGARVRQVTAHPSIHHPPFYYLPPYDDTMNHLFFVSHRTGRPEVFCEEGEGGDLVQLTEIENLNEWSVHPSHDGRFVYFTAGSRACRVDVQNYELHELADFGDIAMKEKGMVGAAMGTTTLSRDNLWWAVPIKVGDRSQFVIVDTSSGDYKVILERDTIGHPEFHPDDANLIRYAGPYRDRMWVIHRDGTGNRLAYARDTARKEWIVHETWLPGTRELLTTNWPHGMISVDIDTGTVRQVCSFNAWHASVNRSGTQMVADTNFPDTGLHLFNPRDGIGQPHPLCLSESSNRGDHWNTDHCPYDDGPVQVYAPQHTHPHPAFSPDGKKVVFTSDKTGFAQVYEVDIPKA